MGLRPKPNSGPIPNIRLTWAHFTSSSGPIWAQPSTTAANRPRSNTSACVRGLFPRAHHVCCSFFCRASFLHVCPGIQTLLAATHTLSAHLALSHAVTQVDPCPIPTFPCCRPGPHAWCQPYATGPALTASTALCSHAAASSHVPSPCQTMHARHHSSSQATPLQHRARPA